MVNSSKVPKIPRNYQIAPGLQRFSRSRLFHKKGLFKKIKKPDEKKIEKKSKNCLKKLIQKKTGLKEPIGRKTRRRKFVKKPIVLKAMSGETNGKERAIAPKTVSLQLLLI